MSNAIAQVGAFVNRKFSINRNTGQPRIRRFSVAEPSANNTGQYYPLSARACKAMGTNDMAGLAVLAKQTQQQMAPKRLRPATELY